MPYQLGARSLARLEGVEPRLVRVVKLAIEITVQDFAVIEGRRTKERQAELYWVGHVRISPFLGFLLAMDNADK